MVEAFSMREVVKTYPDFQLGPLNIDLDPGVVLGYIGPNGSGKTTTMHCLTGLVKADRGGMTIFGKATHPNKPDWKYDIGYVGDNHQFYERWSGEKNLRFISRFYPNWSDSRAQELARRFRLPLQKRARDLSTGNRVKLALVCALAHAPRLLLLDEPTAGLDPVVRAEVLETLFEILEDGERAIFYSTHILSDINRLADELAFLIDGRIVQRSNKEDLTERWRKITFRIRGDLPVIEDAVSQSTKGENGQIISCNHGRSLEHLKAQNVDRIQVTRLTIDEIAVQILKGEQDVETDQS